MNGDYFKGRGAQINTKNKFLSQQFVKEHKEGIDEAHFPDHPRKIFVESPKNILSRNNSPDIPFNYSINPYQGCEHGCVYCYARNVHTYWGFSAGMDWETKIIAKKNASQLLEKEFLKSSWVPERIVLSGNTDPYQPIEQKLKITRSLLQVFVKYQNPVGIITKNNLIVRDLDLLKKLAERHLVRVFFSITTLDEKLRRKLEPRSVNSAKTLQAISLLSENGVETGVMMAPIIPSVNDHEIHAILRQSAENGAITANYTLARFNGDIAEIFYDWLQKNFPDRAKKIWEKVKSFHGGSVNDSRFGKRMQGEGEYAKMIKSMFGAAKKKYFREIELQPLRTDLFRKNGNINLFDE
jgi:DNA repair photolyase